jgi:hypothetical protein
MSTNWKSADDRRNALLTSLLTTQMNQTDQLEDINKQLKANAEMQEQTVAQLKKFNFLFCKFFNLIEENKD